MRAKTTIREISCLVFRFIGEISRFLLQAGDSPLALFMCFRQVVPDVRFRKRHARANPPAPDGFPNRQPCSGQALLRKRKPPSLTVGNMITHFPEKRKSLQHSAFIFCVFFKPSPELRKVIATVAMDSNIEEGTLHPNRDGAWIAIRKKSAERSFTETGGKSAYQRSIQNRASGDRACSNPQRYRRLL